MKNVTKFILLLSILLSSIIYTQEIDKFHYDLGFKVLRIYIPPTLYTPGYWIPESGKIKFTFTRVGILFSGDNALSNYCASQDKVYNHMYQRRNLTQLSCPFLFESRSIIGVKDVEINWSPTNPPQVIKFDYITRGECDFIEDINWLGFGLYQVRILNFNEKNESEYVFYLDFLNSKFGAFDGQSADIEISYDFNKPINERVYIKADIFKNIKATNGSVYRNWDELSETPGSRYGNLYIRGNIPISDLNEDILLSPAIIDMNTTIRPYRDPTVTGDDPELPYSKIIIDPYYYPELLN